MALKNILSGAAAASLGAWMLMTLWHNSACDRVSAAAAPAYWVGKAFVWAMEPFRGYSPEEDEKTSASFYGTTKDLLAKYVYSREGGWQHLCSTDPIQAAKRLGLTDHRDLLRKDLSLQQAQQTLIAAHTAQPKPTAAKAAPAPANAQQTAPVELPANTAAAPQEQAYRVKTWTDLFVEHWGKLLVLLWLTWLAIKIMSHDNKAAYVRDMLSAPVRDLRDLLVHVLPRKALRPSLDRQQTDQTK
ncbi:MAG: hypothetical protein N2690_11015 [Rhodocyclaceae bacterium]|nr:hypothetical protein [Rhodocyclaceae bacterium]